MDPISFCHYFSISKDVPFMFAFALLNCLERNFKLELEEIKKEFIGKGKSSIIDIQSDKKNYIGKPLGGRTRRNGLDTDIDSPVLDCFKYKGRTFYLVRKKDNLNNL